MTGERDGSATPAPRPRPRKVKAPREGESVGGRSAGLLDAALRRWARRRMLRDQQKASRPTRKPTPEATRPTPARVPAILPQMHALEPRLLMAGDVVYALNAGGNGFTDANGVAWVNDLNFTNKTAAGSQNFSTNQSINLTDPSVPTGSSQQLFQTERWDPPSGAEMSYSLGVDAAPAEYQVDLYFADIFSGTQSVNARVFDVLLEGQTVLDDYDTFADVGGYTGVVKTFNIAVDDGVLNIEFLHEKENPALKAVLVRTVDTDPPGPVAPVLDLNGAAAGSGSAATYVAGEGPVNVTAPDALLTDADSATLESLTITIDNPLDGTGNESLSAQTAAIGLTLAYGDGTLTITGPGSAADYQAVLRTVTYNNTAASPDTTTRSISFVANDGSLDSNTAIATVTIDPNTPDPVAPVIDLNGPAAGSGSAATFVSGQGPVAVAEADAVLMDVDSAALSSLTVTLGSRPDGAAEVLDADVSGTGIVKSYADGVLTLSGATSVADYQAVLRSVTYDNSAATPSTATRSLGFVANDGALKSNTATATVSVEIDDPDPQPGGEVVYALNAGGDGFTDANGVAWVNDLNFTNKTAAGSQNFSTTQAINLGNASIPPGTDARLFQTERYDPGSGAEMSYSLGVEPAPAEYRVDLYFADIYSGTQGVGKRVFDVVIEGQTVIDDYDVFADAGGYAGVVKTFNVTVADGVLNLELLHEVENPAIKAILVRTVGGDPEPDPVAPVIDLDAVAPGSGNTATFVPGSGPVAITAADAVLSDADSATLASLTVALSETPDGASERLDADVADTAISKTFAGGILSLSGAASVAEYQAVLRSVTYDNLAATPDGATRTVGFFANDGTLDSNVAVATVAIQTGQALPGTIVADVSTLDFGDAQTGVVGRATLTLTHPGAAIDQPVTITAANITGPDAPAFGTLFTQEFGNAVTLQPGDSIALTVYVLPNTTGNKSATLNLTHSGDNSPLAINLDADAVASVALNFGTGLVTGITAASPTTLQWGPDGRLYVGTLDGLIHAYSITRNGPSNYSVTNSETITLVQDIPNHEDDGTLNTSVDTRLITGIKVVGTAQNPIIYVTSSDPRLTDGNNSSIDTNSGIVSKLTRTGGAGGAWSKVDLVRGLPRSKVDHAPHALEYLAESNTLLVAVGGLTNSGAPDDFFGDLPEYALSAAILKLDLGAIEAMSTKTDANGQLYKYNLPTLDDEDRASANDAGDPFGGNEGKNQAKLEADGPVDIFTSGLRNPYDFIRTQFGHIYTTDNGPNASLGGTPVFVGGQPTNQPNPGGPTAPDNLHLITDGFYAGHPNPTRANTDNTFNNSNPQSPVHPGYTEPADYREAGVNDGAIATFDTSTNGITEYTSSKFGNALNGDLLTVTIDGKLTRLKLSPDGTAVIDREVLFNNSGGYPLDVTTVGDNHSFAGTIWVADLFANPGQGIRVFEPNASNGQATPDDLDGDGYLNQDEIDNGTDPNSAGDTPPDNDTDFTSDLNDPDDDNDAFADLTDPFQIDGLNGNDVAAPYELSFDNDDLNRGGLLNLGFTGLMTNGTTNYLDQFDPANLTAGSAAGVLTIDAVSPGTALGNTNTQENAFQFGLNLNNDPVVIHSKLNSVFDNTTPTAGQRAGIYLGTGDQDNYFSVFVEGNGTINTVTEINGNATFGNAANIGTNNFTNVNLYITIDPAAGTATAAYALGNGPIIDLPGVANLPASWFNAPTAPAVGVIATAGDSGPPYSVTYDFIKADPLAGDNQRAFNGTFNQVGQRVEAEHYDLGGEGVAYFDLTAGNEGANNARPGDDVDLEATTDAGGGANVGWINAGEWLEYSFNLAEAGTYSADFRVALESGPGGTFHLEADGVNVSGPITLPNTGGWQNWTTVTVDGLQLDAGPVVLRVAFDANSTASYVGNLNWLELNLDDGSPADGLDLGDSNQFNWVDAPPIPGPDRFEAMTLTIDNKVYVFGGFADFLSDKLNDVHVYDIATNSWSTRDDMPTTVNHLNPVYDAATGLAYFVGGYKGEYPGEETDEVWVYNVAADSWTQGPDLPTERSAGITAIVGRQLHYIGGFFDRANLASTDHYILDLDNPAAGWATNIVDAPIQRGHASAAVLGDDIYLIGGAPRHDNDNTDQEEVYRFNTVTNAWTRVADLPFGWSHAEPGTFTANGRIFIAGGRNNGDGRDVVNDFYMYDPTADAWVQLPDLPRGLLAPVMTVVDNPAGGQAIYGVTGVFNGLNGTSEAFAADFDDIWDALPNLPQQLGEIAAGVIDNVLYVVGDGHPGTFAYDFTQGTWTNVNSNRPVPAKDQLAEVIDGKLYVMGGISYAGGRQTFNDLQIYDPATNTWAAGTDLPTKIFAAQTTVIGGKIYLSGGVLDNETTTDNTYVYDPTDGPGGSWTQLADAPELRNSAAVGTDGSRMFIFGGRVGGDQPGNGFDTVMIYDPATDTWESSTDPGSTLAELPQRRGGIVNAPFIDGEFYVIGGETDNDSEANAVGLYDRVDIYNPLTNTWRQGAPMITARHGIYPVAHAGAIYIPGGGVVKGASNSNVFDVYYPNLV